MVVRMTCSERYCPSLSGAGDSARALLVSMGSGASLEDFYPSIAINSLMRILKDQALSQHHTMAIQVYIHVNVHVRVCVCTTAA